MEETAAKAYNKVEEFAVVFRVASGVGRQIGVFRELLGKRRRPFGFPLSSRRVAV